MRKWLTIIFLLILLRPMWAQQMEVTDFARQRKGFLNYRHVKTDKQKALLDLTTSEKGFKFLANGKEEAEAEEGENLITVKLPHQTRYVSIKHPDFGQYTWRVPAKYLKKKKRYKAKLIATDPHKAYQLAQQWVVLHILPKNAIVKIDSTVSLIRDGLASLFLPVGSHQYTIESPFYEAVADSFILTDTAKVQLNIQLQPIYSYLSVKVAYPHAAIHVDGKPVAIQEGTSMRLAGGQHQLSVFINGYCFYNKFFTIGRAEKKVIEITPQELVLQSGEKPSPLPIMASQEEKQSTPEPQKSPVTLHASDNETEIWIDREMVGIGKWNGLLTEGYHQVTTRKDSIESVPVSVWIEDSFPQEIDLAVPQTSRGMVNIHSNIVGADIYINNVHVGKTPCVIQNLPGGKNCHIRLSKEGYRDARKDILVQANGMVELKVRMKKHKKKENG